MRKHVLPLALVLTLAALPAAAADKKVPAPKAAPVLARAGEISVAADEFAAYVQRERPGQLRSLSPEQRRGLLEKLVVRKALAAEGEKRGLGSTMAILQRLTMWKIENYPNIYWAHEVDPKVKVTDEEVRDKVNPQERLLLSAIVFGLDEEGRAAAAEAASQLAKGADFAQLARERSLGIAAPKGGDIGWQTLPSKYVDEKQIPALRATPIGGYTAPLETQIGWVLFQVRDRQSAEEILVRETPNATEELLPQKVREERAKRLDKLRAKAKITHPTKDPLGGPRPPVVMVDDNALYDDVVAETERLHGATSVATPEERLAKFVDAYLLVREVERLKLDRQGEVRFGLGLERTEALAQAFLRQEAEKAQVIPEAEMRAEYRRFYVPDVYELQLIIVPGRDQADAALAALAAGADFDKVAKERNDSWLQKTSGKLPVGPLSDYPADVRAAIEALPDGGVSRAFAVPENKFLIAKRIARHTVEVPKFEDVMGPIRDRLVIRRRADFLQDYVAKFRAGLKITVDEGALRSL